MSKEFLISGFCVLNNPDHMHTCAPTLNFT